MTSFLKLLTSSIFAVAILLPGGVNGMQAGGATHAGADKAKMSGSSTSAAPSAQEISDAKSKGLVWANLNTHVYHKAGPSFGTTKRGKFMTEDDATKAGYRAAKEPIAKKPSPTK